MTFGLPGFRAVRHKCLLIIKHPVTVFCYSSSSRLRHLLAGLKDRAGLQDLGVQWDMESLRRRQATGQQKGAHPEVRTGRDQRDQAKDQLRSNGSKW